MALVFQRVKTETAKQRIIYSDIMSDFQVDGESSNDLVPITNEDSVKQSIINLIKTSRGERFFNPLYGSELYRMLFEPATPTNDSVAAELISTAINNFEPRAKLIDVTVSTDPDEHFMVATIIFGILNKEQPIVLDLILNRIR